MENTRTYAAARCALIVAVATTMGCQAPGADNLTHAVGAVAASPAQSFAVAQVADGNTLHYVFCTATICPVVTTKTPWLTGRHNDYKFSAGSSQREPGAAPPAITIDLPFAFNATAIGLADRTRLHAALLASTPHTVTVISRSDALGRLRVRERIAKARAEAVRVLVLDALPATQVTVDIELATAIPARANDRSSQRRATVRFSPFPTHP